MTDKVYCYGWCWEIRNGTASLLLRRFWSKNDWIASRTWNRVKNTTDEKWGRWVKEMRADVNGPDCITIKSAKA